ncbi:hypothetical protein CISG_07622 [Coccidioides immitis RMSCC 3703]|uniref:Uncharacterized protein n=1 Tax=Coccidioides immitis RMSCC 3703 TaxID=454286 RepID=A0A0J8R1D9_COCIT|nr:hypothetical protein CISG_07622 [Coccidioides immitis RMSCC 3703]
MFYRLLALFYLFVFTALGLRVTPGSPCEEKCGPVTTNTTGADVVCRDYEYSRKPEGVVFQDCVKCELRSTFEHRRSYQSDLKWGLYNLRYAFSSCIYAFPVSKQSLSTPCQVTCDSLMDAVKYQLLNPVPQEAYDFCGMDSFSDDFVTKCALCYSLTDDEKLIGNCGLRQVWDETSPQMHPAQAYHYNPASHNGYYGGEQDIKYPPEVYQMGPVSSPPDDTKRAEFVTPTVPTLSAPPPGRKSLSTNQ